MKAMALDLSLTSTGVADEFGTRTIKFPKLTGPERLRAIKNTIIADVIGAQVDLVVIEGYAYGRANQMAALGELAGVVKLALYEADVPVAIIAPAALKKFATGKGNATKEAVLSAAVLRSGIEFQTNDEADAWWLRAMAMEVAGLPIAKLPEAQRVTAYKVEWPVAA